VPPVGVEGDGLHLVGSAEGPVLASRHDLGERDPGRMNPLGKWGFSVIAEMSSVIDSVESVPWA
jgi:hypothetical protein